MVWAILGGAKEETQNFSTIENTSNMYSYQVDYNPQVILGSQGTTIETKKEQAIRQSSEISSELTSDLSDTTSGINPYILFGAIAIIGVGGYFLLK